VASETIPGGRGSERLFWDCATVGRVIEHKLAPATERLPDIVGVELAQLLLHLSRGGSVPEDGVPAGDCAEEGLGSLAAAARAREALGLAAALIGAVDLFVFRRVNDDRYVHIGGFGGGESWAGNVDLILSEERWARESIDKQEPVRRAAAKPERVVGTYSQRFAVIVPVSRDIVVILGRREDGPFTCSDAELEDAAVMAAKAIGCVSPAKRLADELELLHSVQNRTTHVIDTLERELGRAVRTARVDALTGLENRRAWDEALAEQGPDMPAGVIILDINNLKLANDAHGHHLGDELLRAVADILRSAVRRHDLVARLGGDELAVLLPNADEERCQDVANRLRRAVHERQGIRGFPLSISIGYATVPPATSLIEAQRLADERMYTNKGKSSTSARHIPL
jgi:diguanylate cyclase (GGDEF)-like protein